MLENETDVLKEFLKAVERGKELHPDSLSKKKWEDALRSEFEELSCEHCHGVPCSIENNCVERGYRGIEGIEAVYIPSTCLKNLRTYRAEIMDITVVSFRMGIALDKRIEALETKIAMGHDPR